jgi:hypothetical protein
LAPHRPQPTQPSITVATGSTFSGSGLSLSVSVGQPDSRMQAWSPVQVFVDAVLHAHHALAALERPAIQGLMRRWRSSWHSPSATITFRPG